MRKVVFNSNLAFILYRYLPVSFAGLICLPFDLIFAEYLNSIFGAAIISRQSIPVNIVFIGNYNLNITQFCISLLFFGVTPALIRAFLAYKVLGISEKIGTDIFKTIYTRLIHENQLYINKVGEKKITSILTVHLNSFINTFITPIAQAFSCFLISFCYILISIILQPRAALMIFSSTLVFIAVLISLTNNLRRKVAKRLGILRTLQVGSISSALSESSILESAEINNSMTNAVLDLDSNLRNTIKFSLFLSQTARFIIDSSLPIAFVYVVIEFINTGKDNGLLIPLILILKSIPFIQQLTGCISTAQLNIKSYYAIRDLLNLEKTKKEYVNKLSLYKVTEIIIPKLKIKGFHRSYESLILHVNQINLIKGKSGSGKSSYLRFLAGQIEGSVEKIKLINKDLLIDKLDISYFSQSICYQNQFYNLLPLKVIDNIKLLNKDASIRQVKELMKIFGIYKTSGLSNDQLLNLNIQDNPNYLSGGEIQRICLVRLFLSTYPIILVDEPTSSLDEKATNVVINGMKLMSKSKTILISTHEINFNNYAKTIFYMDS